MKQAYKSTNSIVILYKSEKLEYQIVVRLGHFMNFCPSSDYIYASCPQSATIIFADV